jgi:demethylmenaquinone methyltransferase/2-methoxy-6-polyprenyl-1,4-benzoquinol methylase
MFAGIAKRYDLLNHVLSINIDKRWRRFVRQKLGDILSKPDAHVLDVACGTGDLSIELQQHAKARIVGSDFCRPMLEIAVKTTLTAGLTVPYVVGDAIGLPFADDSFDGVTNAFGLRNLSNFADGLVELRRVLKPEG